MLDVESRFIAVEFERYLGVPSKTCTAMIQGWYDMTHDKIEKHGVVFDDLENVTLVFLGRWFWRISRRERHK